MLRIVPDEYFLRETGPESCRELGCSAEWPRSRSLYGSAYTLARAERSRAPQDPRSLTQVDSYSRTRGIGSSPGRWMVGSRR